jgi:tellurite resistance protein
VGIFQYLSYQLKGEEGKQALHDEPSLRAILRAMMATAAADGKVEDSEVESISSIYEQIFGGVPEKDWIRENTEQMLKDDFDIYKAISDERSVINSDLVPLVFKASYFVAASDGSIDESESEILMKIANALGMSDAEVQGALSELQQPESA